jgi:uncharacterized protein (TIGR03067 family)
VKHLTCAAALLILCAATAAADEKALKELEGTYKLTAAEKGGKPAPKELVDSATVTIKGTDFLIAFGDDKKAAKIKVGGDDKLATIDITPGDGPEKGKTFPGIYKIEKGELTIAFTEKTDRPKEFTSADETMLLKLKKVK